MYACIYKTTYLGRKGKEKEAKKMKRGRKIGTVTPMEEKE